MKKVIVIRKNQGKLRKVSSSYEIVNLLTKEKSKQITVVTAKAKNHRETTQNSKSNRAYYVLKGSLELYEGKRKVTVKKGDVVYIPKDTKYTFDGTFEAVIINTPAFDARFDTTTYN